MSVVMMLVNRNLKLYIRDRAAVFFSFLTVLIIIVLNMVFLEKSNVDGILAEIPNQKEAATYFVNTWVLAGIIVTSTVTVTLNMFGIMIEDEDKKRMKTFYTSPISRFKLMLGYVLSSFVMGCIMSIITFIISQIFVIMSGGAFLGLLGCAKVVGVIVLNVFSNACILFFVASLVRTANTFSTINIMVGTLIGFIAGIYLPIGMLPSSVQTMMKLFPVMHGTSLMRKIYVEDAMQQLFQGAPASIIESQNTYRGIHIYMNHSLISTGGQIFILIGSGILFMILSIFLLQKKSGLDR